VVQEAVARFVVGEGEDVVYGPCRSGAGSEVEFYVVFVLVEPGIEQEGLELHASTSKEKLVPVVDSASRRTDDFSLRTMRNQRLNSLPQARVGRPSAAGAIDLAVICSVRKHHAKQAVSRDSSSTAKHENVVWRRK
jgi:hypothetical protein